MVSKVAVIAIVALVAIPIGMGYALNFEDFDVTKHQKDNEVNVTPLLRNSTVTTPTMLNFYEMNTNNFYPLTAVSYTDTGILPQYRTSDATSKSSLQVVSGGIGDFQIDPARGLIFYHVHTGIDVNNMNDVQISFQIRNDELPSSHVDYSRVAGIWAVPVDSSSYRVSIAYYTSLNRQLTWATHVFSNENITRFIPTTTAGYDSADYSRYYLFQEQIDNNDARIKSVIMENGYSLDPSFAEYRFTRGGVNEALITFDLSTVDGGGFRLYAGTYATSRMPIIIRSGENGQTPIIECNIDDDPDDPSAPPVPDKQRQEIIYESGQPNIYQLLIKKTGYQLRYVGNSWPHNVGAANYYRTWDIDFSEMDSYYSHGTYSEGQAIGGLRFLAPWYDAEYPNPDPGSSPAVGAGASIGRMRVDVGAGLGATVPAIKDNTLDPSLYSGLRESITTINSVSMTGTSITFGDATLKAKDGDLIINGKSVSMKGMDFMILYDELNEEYTYSIGNTVIGTSEQKPTITFNGYWGADVAVSKVITSQVTESRWVAGHWAWNGLDNNFSMVGLMASVGAFIALGMYGRRSGAKVLPLMLVCGGAALMFLLMI